VINVPQHAKLVKRKPDGNFPCAVFALRIKLKKIRRSKFAYRIKFVACEIIAQKLASVRCAYIKPAIGSKCAEQHLIMRQRSGQVSINRELYA
jgi:hypothetical protein